MSLIHFLLQLLVAVKNRIKRIIKSRFQFRIYDHLVALDLRTLSGAAGVLYSWLNVTIKACLMHVSLKVSGCAAVQCKVKNSRFELLQQRPEPCLCSACVRFSQSFHVRMESQLVWRFFCRKRPSAMRTRAHPFSTTSSSIKLPTVENRRLPATPPARTLHPIQPLDRRKPPRCPSRQNTPGSHHPAIGSPCLGGTPHLAATLCRVATHPPLATQHPGAIPPITPPPISNACPPPPPAHLSIAGPGACLRPPSQNVPQLAEGTRVDTSIRPPPHLTSPSRLHHHPG